MEQSTIIKFVDSNHFIVISREINDNDSLSEVYPIPTTNVVVYYREDGYISTITNENSVDILPTANELQIQTYSPGDRNDNVLHESWGSHNTGLY